MPCKQQVRQKSVLIDGIFVDVFGADAPGFSAERQKTALQNTSRGFRPELCRLDLGWGHSAALHHRAPPNFVARRKAKRRVASLLGLRVLCEHSEASGWKGKWQSFQLQGLPAPRCCSSFA